MSLYQQSQGYGNIPYPTHGFPQQAPPMPPPGNAYAYPQPQPAYYMEPSSFRRDYASRLSELTVNSRPIIQSLSMIAQDYTRFADIVAQCLEAHIRRVAPWMKLPAFYLLDAISKNVYDPYASKFSGFVIPLFLDTYAQVDQNTRSKMEEMLVTWRTGSPTGKELFGVAAQVKVERTIWGNDSASTSDNSTTRFAQNPPPITRSQVLAELEVTLAQKDRLVNMNPYDTTSKNHVHVLHQLRKLVEAGVSQEELFQILTQLRALARDTASAPPPHVTGPQSAFNAPGSSSQLPFPATSIPQPSYTQSAMPSSQSTYHSQPAMPSSLPYAQFTTSTEPTPRSHVATSGPSSETPALLISDLFNSLVKAGLVPTSSSSNTPLGAGATAQPEESKPEQVDSSAEAAREYARSVFAMKIKLTTSDITRQRPQNVPFLYERLPMQCKQCAIRFPEGQIGKKRMEDHLDMHFRQNRKASQNIGRGHSRSWFVGVESWTHDVADGGEGKGRGNTLRTAKSVAAAETAEREAALRASFVIVPPGDEAKNILCPICKETLKSEFMDEDEEWVWRNAIRIKDKIFHATCHAEMASSNSLAARLRSEMVGGGSRFGTPEIVDSSRDATPPKHAGTLAMVLKTSLRTSKSPTPETSLAGTKRKAEGEASELLNSAGEQTPPAKKVALS